MVTDPIADFLIRIENASSAGKETTSIPFSELKKNIAEILVREGYINRVVTKGEGITKTLEITVKYMPNKTPRLHKTRRISKPSRRLYVSYRDVKPFKFGKGRMILSTPKGIITDIEAKKEKLGGEILFTIW